MLLQTVHQSGLHQTALSADSHIVGEEQRCRDEYQLALSPLERQGDRVLVNLFIILIILHEHYQRIARYAVVTFKGKGYQLVIQRDGQRVPTIGGGVLRPAQLCLLDIPTGNIGDIKVAVVVIVYLKGIGEVVKSLGGYQDGMSVFHQAKKVADIGVVDIVVCGYQEGSLLCKDAVVTHLPDSLLRYGISIRQRCLHQAIEEHAAKGLCIGMRVRGYPHELLRHAILNGKDDAKEQQNAYDELRAVSHGN